MIYGSCQYFKLNLGTKPDYFHSHQITRSLDRLLLNHRSINFIKYVYIDIII